MKGFHYCKNMNNFYYSKLEVTFFIKKIIIIFVVFLLLLLLLYKHISAVKISTLTQAIHFSSLAR